MKKKRQIEPLTEQQFRSIYRSYCVATLNRAVNTRYDSVSMREIELAQEKYLLTMAARDNRKQESISPTSVMQDASAAKEKQPEQNTVPKKHNILTANLTANQQAGCCSTFCAIS